MSNSLQPHGLQHTRLPCPSLSPRVCSNTCPLSWWGHSTISSSIIHFSYPQFFPASQSFPMSWLSALSGQSIGASASVLPMNVQGWFPLRLAGLISLLSKRLSKCSSTMPKDNSGKNSLVSPSDDERIEKRDRWKTVLGSFSLDRKLWSCCVFQSVNNCYAKCGLPLLLGSTLCVRVVP